MKKLKTSALWTLVGIAIGILLLLWFLFTRAAVPATSITSTTLKNSLTAASDLTTTVYSYGRVGKFENSHQINGWDVPFTQKRFLLTYQGTVKLGIDTSELEIRMGSGKITINCPTVEILENTIDEKSVEVYDESMNLLNPISINDYLAFAEQEKAKAAEEVEANGVMEEAENKTRTALVQLLNMIPEIQENYTIEVTFRDRPEKPAPKTEQDDQAAYSGSAAQDSDSEAEKED